MKVSKKCTTVSSCGVNGIYIDVNGSGGASSVATAILADGSAISFEGDNKCGKCLGKGNYHFTVDLDGTKKGANKQGNDVFRFFVNHEKGVYVEDILSNSSKYVGVATGGFCSSSNKCFSDEEATAWVVNFDNMDYLKTTDGTTCPNNTKLTVGGNHSCK